MPRPVKTATDGLEFELAGQVDCRYGQISGGSKGSCVAVATCTEELEDRIGQLRWSALFP